MDLIEQHDLSDIYLKNMNTAQTSIHPGTVTSVCFSFE